MALVNGVFENCFTYTGSAIQKIFTIDNTYPNFRVSTNDGLYVINTFINNYGSLINSTPPDIECLSSCLIPLRYAILVRNLRISSLVAILDCALE